MPWLETDVRDQRIQFVMAAMRPKANVRATCRAFGISPKTGYKFLHRYREAGSVAVLGDQSRRPHRSPFRTCAAVTARVIALRNEFGWAGEKLTRLLDAEGMHLAARTVDRIILREGLTRRDVAPRPAISRFERGAPNELWQMDAKGHYPLAGRDRCYPLSVLDDHSRYAVGLWALPALQGDLVQAALTGCFERYGVPDAMLMDHGVPWWDAANNSGLTRLAVFLLKQGVRLVHGRVRHPQTQGKVERFHRTLAERLRWWGVPTDLHGFHGVFARFLNEYNEIRPHEALGEQPPATRFRASAKAYTPRPAEWEYDIGSNVHRVLETGEIRYQGVRFFISKALAGEWVACTPVEALILVRYRHMFVRELHPQTGHSVSLLQPV